MSEKTGRERCPSICLSFGQENTPQDIQSNKRGVISYFIADSKGSFLVFFHITLAKFLGAHGFIIEISLSEITFERLYQSFILLGFNAFRNGGNAQFPSEADDLFQYDIAAFFVLFGNLTQEAPIQLQFVNIELIQHIQRGISIAKVIHGNTESQGMEGFNLMVQQFQIIRSNPFQYLQRN